MYNCDEKFMDFQSEMTANYWNQSAFTEELKSLNYKNQTITTVFNILNIHFHNDCK